MTGSVGGIFGGPLAQQQSLAPPVFVDTFIRANGPIGAPWVNYQGTGIIAANEATFTPVGGFPEQACAVERGHADVTATLTYGTLHVAGGMCFRLVDANNYHVVVWGGSAWVWYSIVAGTFVNHGNLTGLGGAPSQGTVLTVVTLGANLTFSTSIGGAPNNQSTAQFQTATKFGIAGESSNNSFDRFSCT